jgi:hypothetical protein
MFDGVRKLAPKLDYVSAGKALKSAGAEGSSSTAGGRKR